MSRRRRPAFWPGPPSIRRPPPSPVSFSCWPSGDNREPMAEFLIITGLSGAGRSQAADTFEDLGWFVIDNLPPAMIGKVAELVQSPGSTTERVALVVGTGQYFDELSPALEHLRRTTPRVRVLFL